MGFKIAGPRGLSTRDFMTEPVYGTAPVPLGSLHYAPGVFTGGIIDPAATQARENAARLDAQIKLSQLAGQMPRMGQGLSELMPQGTPPGLISGMQMIGQQRPQSPFAPETADQWPQHVRDVLPLAHNQYMQTWHSTMDQGKALEAGTKVMNVVGREVYRSPDSIQTRATSRETGTETARQDMGQGRVDRLTNEAQGKATGGINARVQNAQGLADLTGRLTQARTLSGQVAREKGLGLTMDARMAREAQEAASKEDTAAGLAPSVQTRARGLAQAKTEGAYAAGVSPTAQAGIDAANRRAATSATLAQQRFAEQQRQHQQMVDQAKARAVNNTTLAQQRFAEQQRQHQQMVDQAKMRVADAHQKAAQAINAADRSAAEHMATAVHGQRLRTMDPGDIEKIIQQFQADHVAGRDPAKAARMRQAQAVDQMLEDIAKGAR